MPQSDDDEIQILPGPDLPTQEWVLAEAMAKFPKEYAEIVRKYGAVEFELSEDGKTLLGLAAPTDYLAASDRIELSRLSQDNNSIDAPERPLSSSALGGLAEGFLAYALAQWDRLRTDPEYLAEQVVAEAHVCPELFPYKDSYRASSVEQLLSRAGFVAIALRSVIVKAYCEAADWSVLLEYLRDVAQLDAEHGRFGAVPRRAFLMSQVKKLMDRRQRAQLGEFKLHASFRPRFRPFGVRTKGQRGDEWTLELDRDRNLDLLMRQKGTVDHELACILLADHVVSPHDLSARSAFLRDLERAMTRASDSERSGYSDGFLTAYSNLQMTSQIIVLLGTDHEDWESCPLDGHMKDHVKKLEQMLTALGQVNFTKHFKAVDNVRTAKTVRKMWAEVDEAFRKIVKTPKNKIYDFISLEPAWIHAPTVTPDAEVESTPPESEDDAEPAVVYVGAIRIASTEEKPTASVLKPISDLAASREKAKRRADAHPLVERQAPKVKTRGVPAVRSAAQERAVDEDAVQEVKPIKPKYKVGPDAYDTFKQCLVRTEKPVDWREFSKALFKIGFSMENRGGGSKVVYKPITGHTNRWFHIHRPHPDHLIPVHEVQRIGRQLKDQYTMDMSWFSEERSDE